MDIELEDPFLNCGSFNFYMMDLVFPRKFWTRFRLTGALQEEDHIKMDGAMEAKGLTSQQIEKSLKLSTLDGFFYSLMVGMGETYLAAYGLASGLTAIQAGFMTSMPLIAGAILQLISPWAIRYHVKSHKRWVLVMAVVQGLMFLPLSISTYTGIGFIGLFFISSFYFAAAYSTGGAWNFWMAKLVPSERAPTYYSKRNRVVQFGIVLGMVLGGIALENSKAMPTFAILFFLAWLCRMASVGALYFQEFLPEWENSDEITSLNQVIKRMIKGEGSTHYFGSLFFFYVGVYFTAPFVNPFLLVHLKLSYFQYMIAMSTLFLTKVLVMPLVGRVIEKFGRKKVFLVCMFAIAPMPIMWLLPVNFALVLFVQFITGIFWGGFEICMVLNFTEGIQDREKAAVLSLYHLLLASAVVMGTFAGGILLSVGGVEANGYSILFLVGACVRVLCLFPLYRYPFVVARDFFLSLGKANFNEN